jgi:hypothetical protein
MQQAFVLGPYLQVQPIYLWKHGAPEEVEEAQVPLRFHVPKKREEAVEALMHALR